MSQVEEQASKRAAAIKEEEDRFFEEERRKQKEYEDETAAIRAKEEQRKLDLVETGGNLGGGISTCSRSISEAWRILISSTVYILL